MMVGSVTTYMTRSLSLFYKEDQQIKSDMYVVSIGHMIIIAATEMVFSQNNGLQHNIINEFVPPI